MRRIRSLWLALLMLCGAHAAPAPQFRLRDTNAIVHTEEEWRGRKAVVLFYVITDCPLGNRFVPEMRRIQETYESRGVRFYAVQSDRSAPDAAVAEYAREYQYSFPVLLDPQQVLVKLGDATVVPQAVVLSPRGEVLYRGRIDNRVEDFGVTRPSPTRHDLREALDAVLAGRAVPHPRTKSIGCAIDRLP